METFLKVKWLVCISYAHRLWTLFIKFFQLFQLLKIYWDLQYIWAISGNIFGVCMCHIKSSSNFCFPISCLSVPKKSLNCSHYPPCYPRSSHLEWPYHSLYTLLVEFTGKKFVRYLRVCHLGILQIAVMYIMYQEPTKFT